MRVAVTGASGFIGRKVTEYLVAKGHKVISVGRTDPKIEGVQHNDWSLQKKVNVIVHCAAENDEWTPTPQGQELRDVNLSLTDKAMKINPRARFILLSSSAVYQTSENSFNPVEELVEHDTPMLNAFAVSKAISEHLTTQEAKDGRYYILRPRAVYGQGDTHLLPRLEEYAKGYFVLPGKNPMGSLTNIKTLCDVIDFFVNDIKEKHFGIYNVADGEPVNMHDTLVSILAKRGREAKMVRLPYAIAFKSALSMETKARKKGTIPLVTRSVVAQIGRDSVMDISKLETAMKRKMPLTDISDASDW